MPSGAANRHKILIFFAPDFLSNSTAAADEFPVANIGSTAITYFGLIELGGFNELRVFASENVAQYALWRPLSDPDFPWLGILIASPIVGIWYWCTDQYIVQRTLAAKDLKTARRGALLGAFFKIWPVLIFLVPGLIGAALNAKGILEISIDTNGNIIGDQVFPTMVATLLPEGLRGLVVAGIIAALMSSLSSLFNSTATLFTLDIYKKIKPKVSEQKLVLIGRMATLVVVVFGLLWIPIMPMISKGGLYQYLQSVQGYLAPPITAVFLLGLFNSRINNKGATWGLSLGFFAGMLKLIIQAFFGKEKMISALKVLGKQSTDPLPDQMAAFGISGNKKNLISKDFRTFQKKEP